MKRLLFIATALLFTAPAFAQVSSIQCTDASVSKSTGVSSETVVVTCQGEVQFLNGQLLQTKGQRSGEANGYSNGFTCTGSAQTFTITNRDFYGYPISSGQAVCGGYYCDYNQCASIPPNKINVKQTP